MRLLGWVVVVLGIPFTLDIYFSGFPWVALIGVGSVLMGLYMALVLPAIIERRGTSADGG